MKEPASWLSWLVNPRLVPVRIWCDQQLRTIVGDTAEHHMLIGQRRWSLQQTGPTHSIFTEAYERPRGFVNRLGMFFAGRERQVEVWRAYLQNILEGLSQAPQVSGAIFVSSPENVSGNPWDPHEPYPGCVSDKVLLTFVVGVVIVFVVWMLSVFVLDTPIRRSRTAKRLLALGYAYRKAPGSTEHRRSIFRELARRAKSPKRFECCYAIFVLGWLLRVVPEEIEAFKQWM